MTTRYKIYPHTDHHGIHSWLEWDGDALVAHAVKVSEDRMQQVNAFALVPTLDSIRTFVQRHDRPYTSPEKYARDQAVRKVKDKWHALAFKEAVRGTDAAAEKTNGGW